MGSQFKLFYLPDETGVFGVNMTQQQELTDVGGEMHGSCRLVDQCPAETNQNEQECVQENTPVQEHTYSPAAEADVIPQSALIG